MSVQFGRWNLDGKPIEGAYLAKVKETLVPYGPDGGTCFASRNVAILYHAFHTTKESRSEVQPHVCPSGVVITWDGRLDNRADLVGELRDPLTAESTDVAIVAAAYEMWGTNCFGKLIGDWALSIWNANGRSLILAKDPVGVRKLYYSFDNNQVSWSTILDPLIRLAGKTFELNEEYIAGWLSMFPAVHLTPCVGVHSVPPSSFVLLHGGKRAVKKHWDFNPNIQIRYRNDSEYEEHFRTVFGTAVQRRLRSDRPVLAELSGGRDSSSIVCMADEIIAHGVAETPRLDTLSYYDDSEPNWNERPYFTKIEQKRGRTGWHIDVGLQCTEQTQEAQTTTVEGSFAQRRPYTGHSSSQFDMCIKCWGTRAVLSGIGGDEVMGGVPTPLPELEDLLARARFGVFARQLRFWALEQRKPWFHLLWEAVCAFLPVSLVAPPTNVRPAPWLQARFVMRNWVALTGYHVRTSLFSSLPSFQENVSALDALRRQLAHCTLPFEPPYEKRYPYLDRGLLEFMFSIPREQLVRPRQRRSLMRRALVGIVPEEILNRKGKAFVVRGPIVALSNDLAHYMAITTNMLGAELGIVDSERLSEAVQKVGRGEDAPIIALSRTFDVERRLSDLRALGHINLTPRLAQPRWNFFSQGHTN